MSRIHHFTSALLVASGLFIGAASQAAADPAQAELLSRGQYLATAADCAACHTAQHGQPFAGGLPIVSPVGTIFASNITPSTAAGIGAYSERQFADALRKGVRADGANLYPAMPYTSYAQFTDADVHALYTYFMHGVAAVDQPAPKTALPFPMNIRSSMMGWNLLFLDGKPFQNDPAQSVEWNRGKYLVLGAAHCSACHTARGFLMNEEGGRALGGGQVGAWFAPNITPDPVAGIGSWTQQDLVSYLRAGKLRGKAQAAGSMGEAVEHSFQHMTDADLNAMATYVRSIPAVSGPAGATSRFGQGGASGAALDALRGAKPVASADAGGALLFQANCASCHSAHAEGSKDGYFPSLYHNSVTGGSNANNLIATIVNGVKRTVGKSQAFMPGFGPGPNDLNPLTDTQVATLATYMMKTYGQGLAQPVTAQQVAAVRQGGPASDLLLLARVALGAGLVLVLLLWLWWWQRRRATGTALA